MLRIIRDSQTEVGAYCSLLVPDRYIQRIKDIPIGMSFILILIEEKCSSIAYLFNSSKYNSINRMILITQGDGEFLFDDVPFSFSVGTLIFGFEGERFSLKHGNTVRYLYIDFNGEREKTICRRVGIYPHTRKEDNFDSLIPFCLDCLLRTPPKNIDIAGESVLFYVLSRLSTKNPSHNDAIQSIVDFTEKHFRDPELSVSVIADELGYNPKYLSHLFKQKTNMNYSEYLRSIRFKYAISLFELGISSVKNVALLSGFSDPLYFSNAFKKAIGISPKEFILKHSDIVEKK